MIEDAINRHERIALQLSGGKDSLACLYLMKPYWDSLTVYWCNTGDAFPETVSLMGRIRAEVPHFVEIEGRQPEAIATFGIPSDIVPANSTMIGRIVGSNAPAIQDRYSCCAISMMIPTMEKMVEDKITLIIRGQKESDRLKGPAKSGVVENGIEYLFPIEGWDSRKVLAFLRDNHLPVPRFYEMLTSAPDCMTCSAWWEEGFAKYMKRYHHDQYQKVQHRLNTIKQAVGVHIEHFNNEVNQ